LTTDGVSGGEEAAVLMRNDPVQFSPDQRRRLREILGMTDEDEQEGLLDGAELVIRTAVEVFRENDERRRAAPTVKEASRSLRAIKGQVDDLRTRLRNEPLAVEIFKAAQPQQLSWLREQFAGLGGPQGEAVMRASQPASPDHEQELARLMASLQMASLGLERMLKHEGIIRVLHSLPPAGAEHEKAVAALWRYLFLVWVTYFERRLTFSLGGPLYLYIKLVHEVAGLGKPTPTTLRKALERYKLKFFRATSMRAKAHRPRKLN
jgi:hypothetical protein